MLTRCLLCCAALLGLLCSPLTALSQADKELTISAAISLKDAFEEIGKLFQKQHADVKICFNFGASGALAGQIEAGAPVDVFASAAQKDMDVLQGKGLLLARSRSNFARNSLVFIAPAKAAMHLRAADDLRMPDVKKIAIGNPATVPAGRYAIEALRSFQLYETLKPKFVFGENVRQVLDYVARGEVDAGIVYKTDAFVQPGGVSVFLQPPEESHSPVLYPIAVLAASKNVARAQQCVDFVSTAVEVRTILQKYGFAPASQQH